MEAWMGLAALVLFACEDPDYELTKEEVGTEVAPIVRVEPSSIDFGALPAGDVATESFAIWNDGNVTLDVDAVRIDSSSQFIVTTTLPLTIEPGAYVDVDVVFTPTDVRAQGFARVDSNDPATPTETVTLLGGGLYPLLGVRPVPFDFSSMQPGCSRTAPLTLTNIGGATLELDQLVIVADGFALTTPFVGPVSLEPAQETSVDVVFSPQEERLYDGELYVTSNEQVGVRTVPLYGEGAISPSENVDTFRQPDGPWDKTDILIYIDQSCSMIDDQETLLANFHVFTENMESFLSDYQIMFTTEDSGCHSNEIITPYTEDGAAAAAAALNEGVGLRTEAGFTITKLALEQVGTGDCNEGFLRDDAKTILMMVSDEIEQSRNAWTFYVGEFQAAAPSASVVAIVGDYPAGCETADPGVGYYEAAMATGGDVFSICESAWDEYFQEIAVLASDEPTDTFVLSWVPEVETIQAAVDGAVLTAWEYDAALNAVVFDAMPASGAWIEISYDVAEACE